MPPNNWETQMAKFGPYAIGVLMGLMMVFAFLALLSAVVGA